MNTVVRSNRFNYNKEYKGPRFYTFSTWAHDITQYFMTSSGTVAVPVAYIALKLEKPVSEVKDMLEAYFENKIAWYQKQLTDKEDSEDYKELSNQYAPLQYLFDGLELCGAFKFRGNTTAKVIFGDISEQNYNGSFTDIICTIPHGAKIKTLKFTQDSLIKLNLTSQGELLYIREPKTNTYSLKKSIIDNPDEDSLYFDRNLLIDAPLQWDKDVDQVFWDIPSNDGNYTMRIWTDYVIDENDLKVPRKFVEDIFGASSTQGQFWKLSEKMSLLSYYNDHIDIICNVLDTHNNTKENIVKVSIPDNQYTVKMITGENVLVQMKGQNIDATWEVYDKDELSNVLSIYPTSQPIVLTDITLTIETLDTFNQQQGTNYVSDNDTLLGWTDLRNVYYDNIVISDQNTVTGGYNFSLEPSESFVQFSEVPDQPEKFYFNCIIPLYKEYNRDSQLIEPETVETNIPLCGSSKLTPLGIWFNEEISEDKYQEIEVTLADDTKEDKYTASWSLSISNQIKPYYASNSVPVNYTDSTDVENTMQTFSGVLSRVQELGKVVKHLQESIPHNVTDINTTQGLINRVVSQERMVNLLTSGLSDKSKEILQLKEDQKNTSLTLGSTVSECVNTVNELQNKTLELGTVCNNLQITSNKAEQCAYDTKLELSTHLVDYQNFTDEVHSKFQELNNSIEAIQDDISMLIQWNTLLSNVQKETLKKLQVVETYWPIITMFVGNNSNAIKLSTSEESYFMEGETPVGKSTGYDLYNLTQFLTSLLNGPNRNYTENGTTE